MSGQTLSSCRKKTRKPIDEAPYRGDTFRHRLGDVLVDSGHISEEEKEMALVKQKNVGQRHLGEVLVDMGLIDEMSIARVLAAQLKLRFVGLDEISVGDPNSDARDLIRPQLALRDTCVPIYVDDERIVLAMANPLDLIAIEDVELASNRRVEPVVATTSDILMGLGRLYRKRNHPVPSYTANEHGENGAPAGRNEQSDETGASHESTTY